MNFNKDDFDKIKKHCDDNALDMSKWIVKIAFEKIEMTSTISNINNTKHA